MRKIFILLCSFAGLFAYNEEFKKAIQYDSSVWGRARVENIDSYYNYPFAEWFVWLQSSGFFANLALFAIIAVLVAFVGHYAIVGPKSFSHDHGKVYAFNVLERLTHAVAALSWVILVPTGIIINVFCLIIKIPIDYRCLVILIHSVLIFFRYFLRHFIKSFI